MKRRFVLVLVSALACSSITHAATRYVSKTGGNTAPYTSWGTAARTINAASGVSSAGDTIIVGQTIATIDSQN